MPTLEQLTHKHKVTISRTVSKDDGELAATRVELAQTLGAFLANKQVRTAVDGEVINLSLQLYVFTEDELKSLVEGLDQAKPVQGELHVGNDPS